MELEKVSFPSPWTLATYHSELTRNSRSRYLKVEAGAGPGGRAAGAAVPALIAQGGFMLFGAEMHIVTIAVQPDVARAFDWGVAADGAAGAGAGGGCAYGDAGGAGQQRDCTASLSEGWVSRRSGIGGAITRTRKTRASWRWRSCTGSVCGSRCGSGSRCCRR